MEMVLIEQSEVLAIPYRYQKLDDSITAYRYA